MEIAEAFARQLNAYLPSVVEQLKTHLQLIEVASEELGHIREAIVKDERILGKYVPFIYRLQRVLWRHFSSS